MMLWKRQTAETVTASVRLEPGRAEISLGSRSFQIVGPRTGDREREDIDFALYGLAVIAMTHNVQISLDGPVTESALVQLRKLGNIWQRWTPRKVYPLKIEPSAIIGEDNIERRGGMLCMSGGVDSTYAALRASQDYGFSHALLIGGADYMDPEGPGFRELKQRVANLSAMAGLELTTVATNLKKLRIRWGLFHTLLLAMCLRYAGRGLGFGGWAADYTDFEAFMSHPWGNNRIVASLIGTPGFHIHYLGAEVGRSKKVRSIIADSRPLIEHVSVCYSDSSSGGNCGKCEKCLRTRLNIATASSEMPHLFKENNNLLNEVKRMGIPRRRQDRNVAALRMSDIYFDLPEGELRDAVGRYLKRLARPRGGRL